MLCEILGAELIALRDVANDIECYVSLSLPRCMFEILHVPSCLKYSEALRALVRDGIDQLIVYEQRRVIIQISVVPYSVERESLYQIYCPV